MQTCTLVQWRASCCRQKAIGCDEADHNMEAASQIPSGAFSNVHIATWPTVLGKNSGSQSSVRKLCLTVAAGSGVLLMRLQYCSRRRLCIERHPLLPYGILRLCQLAPAPTARCSPGYPKPVNRAQRAESCRPNPIFVACEKLLSMVASGCGTRALSAYESREVCLSICLRCNCNPWMDVMVAAQHNVRAGTHNGGM